MPPSYELEKIECGRHLAIAEPYNLSIAEYKGNLTLVSQSLLVLYLDSYKSQSQYIPQG